MEYIVKSFYRRDGNPGWVHSLAPDGSIANPMRDGYAHAFVLLGLAWYHRLTGDAQAVSLIDETIAYLDEHAASSHGGYLDAVPPPDSIRRQNPHMHLFEAYLALYKAVGKSSYLARGAELFGVFATGFFQPTAGWLCEYMTEDLDPLPPPEGHIVEPGHHYEWIWLLRCFEKCSGKRVETFCSPLYEHANRYGWDAQGYIVDEVDPLGRVLKGSRRSWPHTEAAKANIVEGESGRDGCDERAARAFARLSDTFLGRPFPGGWIDRIDADGKSMAPFVPASTLYHVFCATAEAARATSP
jgi:mannose-6-phosphate isomerase